MVVGIDSEKMPSELELFHAHILIHNQTQAIAGSFSLKCAAELGVADIIHKLGRPATLSELASAASIPPEREPMLQRLLRLLVHAHVLAAVDGGAAYALTPSSKLLLRDGANVSPHVLAVLDEKMIKPWFFLADWLQTKDEDTSSSRPFPLAYGGRRFWEVANDRPDLNKTFNEAMAASGRLVAKAVVAQIPEVFQGLQSLVDVGGGTESAARIISDAFPEIKCTVYDLLHVVATLPEINSGIKAVGGDMFNHIPPAQAVMLMCVLHNWSDEDCVKILKRCKEAIPEKEKGGKIIIVDVVVNSQKDNPKVSDIHLFFDMTMMVGVGGQEREEHEWKKIFTTAGITNYKIYTIMSVYSVIELYPYELN